MFVYNVTFNIEESIQEKWLTWMYNDFFMEAIVFKNFTSATIHQVLIEEELGGITFAVHFNMPTTTQLVQFQLQDLTLLEAKMEQLFEGKYVLFNTELQIISTFQP